MSEVAVVSRRRGRRAAERPRRRVSVIGVLGELLITAGVLVLAFLGWQIWLGDIIVGNQLDGEASEQSQEWDAGFEDVPPVEVPDPQEPVTPVEPVVFRGNPANAERFANLIIPRFGSRYNRPIAEGIGTTDVLNVGNIGHYPTTQMPGERGNFALASHRSSGGGNFHDLHELEVGDHIYVETKDGWYLYVFRNIEYVAPTGVGVLNPVPQVDGPAGDERYITMTTCNPFFSVAERLIAYGVFETFFPRSGGVPAEIESNVKRGA